MTAGPPEWPSQDEFEKMVRGHQVDIGARQEATSAGSTRRAASRSSGCPLPRSASASRRLAWSRG